MTDHAPLATAAGARGRPDEVADALLGTTVGALEALVTHHLPGWRLPGSFGGHRVGADVRADLVFTLGLVRRAGVASVAGSDVDDVIADLLGGVDGAATDTFSSYRVGETLLARGPFEDNPVVAGLDPTQRHELAQAVDSTSFLPLLDGLLPRNYAAVLARCELARQALGLPTDAAVLADLIDRTRSLLAANPGGYLDDSEDGAGARYDIYSVDVYLFCEPLAPLLGPVWEHGLANAVDLVEQTQAANGAALVWGRSTGVLALCHAVELAALALERGIGDDPARWLARARLATVGLDGWFGHDGVIAAHQHRSPYGYRGPSRRLQMTLDCLGKLAWAADRLRRRPDDGRGPPHPPRCSAPGTGWWSSTAAIPAPPGSGPCAPRARPCRCRSRARRAPTTCRRRRPPGCGRCRSTGPWPASCPWPGPVTPPSPAADGPTGSSTSPAG